VYGASFFLYRPLFFSAATWGERETKTKKTKKWWEAAYCVPWIRRAIAGSLARTETPEKKRGGGGHLLAA
jgi:hypothetical protein